MHSVLLVAVLVVAVAEAALIVEKMRAMTPASCHHVLDHCLRIYKEKRYEEAVSLLKPLSQLDVFQNAPVPPHFLLLQHCTLQQTTINDSLLAQFMSTAMECQQEYTKTPLCEELEAVVAAIVGCPDHVAAFDLFQYAANLVLFCEGGRQDYEYLGVVKAACAFVVSRLLRCDGDSTSTVIVNVGEFVELVATSEERVLEKCKLLAKRPFKTTEFNVELLNSAISSASVKDLQQYITTMNKYKCRVRSARTVEECVQVALQVSDVAARKQCLLMALGCASHGEFKLLEPSLHKHLPLVPINQLQRHNYTAPPATLLLTNQQRPTWLKYEQVNAENLGVPKIIHHLLTARQCSGNLLYNIHSLDCALMQCQVEADHRHSFMMRSHAFNVFVEKCKEELPKALVNHIQMSIILWTKFVEQMELEGCFVVSPQSHSMCGAAKGVFVDAFADGLLAMLTYFRSVGKDVLYGRLHAYTAHILMVISFCRLDTEKTNYISRLVRLAGLTGV